MTVKTKPCYGIGCNSGIEEMSLLQPICLLYVFVQKITTLRYKAVNMGTFLHNNCFFTNFPKIPKKSQKMFGDFFGKKRTRKILLYTRLKGIVSTKHNYGDMSKSVGGVLRSLQPQNEHTLNLCTKPFLHFCSYILNFI